LVNLLVNQLVLMKNLRKRTANLLEAHYGAGGWGHVVDLFLIVLILTNVLLIILETVPSIFRPIQDDFYLH